MIAPVEMSDGEIDEFRSNLREVMLHIEYSKDKMKLGEITENDSKFQSMERQAAESINVVTGSKLKCMIKSGSTCDIRFMKMTVEIYEENT
ncbi:MAG: hypothetical protein NC489_31800 [Ruminococcus flavefaciens]|nr:hypothetical protein [Ruminococcus flavefaciens]